MAAILAPVAASSQEAANAPLVVRDWLVIEPVDAGGRIPIRCNAVFARYLLARDAKPPAAGDVLSGELGKEATWARSQANAAGYVEGALGWAYAAVESDTARVAIAELPGATTLYVNGAPYVGDGYGYSSAGVPVTLRQGTNDVYVTGIREKFLLRLRKQTDPFRIVARESTLPDATSGLGWILAMNATDRPMQLVKPCRIRLAPLQATNLPFEFDLGSIRPGSGNLAIEFATADGASPLKGTLATHAWDRSALHRETYRSTIDGSVQTYAVLPPSEGKPPESGHGLVLTLHGRQVSASNHLSMYSPKPDFWLVAPANRRPSGFEWQDWDRLDAYEVLEHALGRSGVGADRVYLAGYSMGGHGAWKLAANDPDRFTAVAPSAGWIVWETSDGRPEGSLADVWRRADGGSRTLELLSNLMHTPFYILHGSKDEVVPVQEALDAMKSLGEPVPDFRTLYVREGGRHAWDGSEADGVDCVDWPPVFELFRRHPSMEAASGNDVDWISVDPVVDAQHEWVHVDQPLEYGRPFRLKGRRDRDGVALETVNVRRLRIDASAVGEGGKVTLDGTEVSASTPGWYLRSDGAWRADAAGPASSEKGPDRSGPFKRAFDRNFVFVVGTQGDEVEDRELLELARYEATAWWYRANGTVSVFTDGEFLADPVHVEPRNVILFGNEDTNAAWKTLLPKSCPVRAKRGSIELRGKAHEGDDLACLFVYPRSDVAALVGAFADSGPRGARLLATVPVFVPGVGLPDFTLFGPKILERGDDGVLAAGWFDYAWR